MLTLLLHGVRHLAHAILGQFPYVSGLVLKRRDRDTGSGRVLVFACPSYLPFPPGRKLVMGQRKKPILSGFLSNFCIIF